MTESDSTDRDRAGRAGLVGFGISALGGVLVVLAWTDVLRTDAIHPDEHAGATMVAWPWIVGSLIGIAGLVACVLMLRRVIGTARAIGATLLAAIVAAIVSLVTLVSLFLAIASVLPLLTWMQLWLQVAVIAAMFVIVTVVCAFVGSLMTRLLAGRALREA